MNKFIGFAIIFLVSCNNIQQPGRETTNDNIDTLKHSDKFNGVFAGTTPCADCPGIYTIMEFSPDSSYVENLRYLERNSEFWDTGKWQIKDSVITVRYNNDSSQIRYFRIINDSTIRMLDADKNIITGALEKNYILKKKDTLLSK